MRVAVFWFALLGLVAFTCRAEDLAQPSLLSRTSQPPRNVVLMIGDGMGFEQIKAARSYRGRPLLFERLANRAQATTFSANSAITDSAAAATAIATGHKVNNGVLSMAVPGDGSDLETLLEYFKKRGKRTGLVTTTEITHATPAAFAAHQRGRNLVQDIARDYFTRTKPNLLFGGTAAGISRAAAASAGYVVVKDRAALAALEPGKAIFVSGQFGPGHLPYEIENYGELPHLHQMARKALELLGEGKRGFFLMIEGGRIDQACHGKDLARMVPEVLEFGRTYEVVKKWAGDRADTLIVVTADHETGGLQVVDANSPGTLPAVTWVSSDHTGRNVPVYAWGDGAAQFQGVLDNTEFFAIITSAKPAAKAANE